MSNNLKIIPKFLALAFGYDFVVVGRKKSKPSFLDFKTSANQIILAVENEWNSFPTYLS